MPSSSEAQHNFMLAEYGRAKRGEPTRSGMSLEKLREWVHADMGKKAFRKALKKKK
jgi:hypothetical protein